MQSTDIHNQYSAFLFELLQLLNCIGILHQFKAFFHPGSPALPLSQTSHMIRSISAGEGLQMTGIAVLGAYLVVFTAIASWFIYKKKNL